ncbi:MAG TPA: hypothetical protein VFV34_26430, partial [Blastocatellia bacterium]|nr:hypothetical protein [Blastocatellia bacterium]
PMLIVAGLIEGFISPSDIPAYYKLTVSATSALVLLAYFLKPDRREAVTSEGPGETQSGKQVLPGTNRVQKLPGAI